MILYLYVFLLLILNLELSLQAQKVEIDMGYGNSKISFEYFNEIKANKYYNYNMLHEDTLVYKTIDLNKSQLIEQDDIIITDSLRFISTTYENNTVLPLQYTINEYIDHESKLKALDISRPKHIPNTLKMFDIAFNIDSLHWGNFYNKNYAKKVVPVSAYVFKQKRVLYLLIYTWYFSGTSTTNHYKALLFMINDRQPKYIEVPGMQASTGILSFGDFNRNGNIDYAQWNINYGSYKDSLFVYELNEYNFIKLDDIHLVMKHVKSEGYTSVNKIDLSKSNWFFKL